MKNKGDFSLNIGDVDSVWIVEEKDDEISFYSDNYIKDLLRKQREKKLKRILGETD